MKVLIVWEVTMKARSLLPVLQAECFICTWHTATPIFLLDTSEGHYAEMYGDLLVWVNRAWIVRNKAVQFTLSQAIPTPPPPPTIPSIYNHDKSTGMEAGIRLYLPEITAMLVELIDASAWTTKAQAARAMATVAERMGSQLGPPHLGQLLDALLAALLSRTWTGKVGGWLVGLLACGIAGLLLCCLLFLSGWSCFLLFVRVELFCQSGAVFSSFC